MIDEYGYVVNVDGVVVREEEYLLIERARDEDHAAGRLGFPGGKLESPPDSEDAIETTVSRELREEVGIEVGDVEYVYSTTFEADDGSPCLEIVTLCEYLRGDAAPRAPDEVAAVHWLSSEELEARDDVPEFTERYVALVEEFRDEN